MQEGKPKKVVFASILRGVAAFMVAFNHLSAIFFVDLENTRRLIHDSDYSFNGTEHNLLFRGMHWFANRTDISWGVLGVAIFFLISGFVIPFSLEKRTFWKFMGNRIMRIIPTAAVALALAVLVLLGCGLVFPSNHYHFSFWEFISNTLMFRPFVGQQFIDPVTWTLEIEMMFYIMIGMGASFLDLKKPKSILVIGIGMALVSLIARVFIPSELMAVHFLNQISYWLIFMLFGTCFYNRFRRNWSQKEFACAFLGLGAIWLCSKNLISMPKFEGAYNMSLALIVFGGGYLANSRLRESKFTSFFANISYPLYISHQIVGYVLVAYLTWQFKLPASLTVIGVFSLMIAYAWVLHRFVEVPTQKISKNL